MDFTYKEDDSFFTHVLPPATLFGSTIYNWFNENGSSRFRLIRDAETELSFMSLKQVDELYPGVKTFSIVINPWARMRYAYLAMLEAEKLGGHPLIDAFGFTAKTFEEFILTLPKINNNSEFWFTPTTPLIEWLEYEIDGKVRQVDYILRAESLDEDMKPIKDYFCSDKPLRPVREIPPYREYYTEEMKQIVAELFSEDIKRFNYTF
jgi:hypothetical protein